MAVEVRRFEGEVRRIEAREAERARRMAAEADRDLARAMRHVVRRAQAPAAQPGTPGYQVLYQIHEFMTFSLKDNIYDRDRYTSWEER